MLPGKKYTPEDLSRLLWQRRWILLVPLALVSAATVWYASTLPDIYRSETLISVVPQRVPEAFVRNTVTTRIQDSLPSIEEKIKSRTRLERLIEDLDLYPAERQMMIMEDVVQLMRASINIETDGRSDTFRVSFVGRDPQKVMEVTNRVTSSFIDESLLDRQSFAQNTDQFLESEVQTAKQRLLETEKKVEAYRMSHADSLPSQLQSNLQQIETAQTQVQATLEAVNRLHERRLGIERRIADLEAAEAAPGLLPANANDRTSASNTADQLTAAQATLATEVARGRLPGHPDLESAKRRVQELEQKLASEMAGGADRVTVSPAELRRRANLAEAKTDLAGVDRELDRAREQEKRLRAVADDAQQRVNAVPARESELVELMRDYDTYNATYKDLLGRQVNARMASNLERRQVGEQFRVIDPAERPERPISPNRSTYYLGGLGAGLLIGLGILAFLEYRDRTLKTDEDVARLLDLPVLAVVPIMASAADRRLQAWRHRLIDTGLSGVVLACVALVIYALVR